mmetsp:Transcript_10221/g.22028  ORF Transcript_10221/g.22028 Transcript_10221/m.22028 type:complete len:200 (-) Transcript_10221:478-1077(-)
MLQRPQPHPSSGVSNNTPDLGVVSTLGLSDVQRRIHRRTQSDNMDVLVHPFPVQLASKHWVNVARHCCQQDMTHLLVHQCVDKALDGSVSSGLIICCPLRHNVTHRYDTTLLGGRRIDGWSRRHCRGRIHQDSKILRQERQRARQSPGHICLGPKEGGDSWVRRIRQENLSSRLIAFNIGYTKDSGRPSSCRSGTSMKG